MKKKILKFLIVFIVVIIIIFIAFIIADELNLVNLKNKTNDIQNAENENLQINNIENQNIVSENTNVTNQNNYEEKATDFTLVDQNGNTVSLNDYRGKKVVIIFWAVWCPPCREEIPDINELSKEYDNAVFLTIVRPEKSSDLKYETYKEEINGYIQEHNITIPVLIDENKELFDFYGIDIYPSIVFIDEDGNIKKKVPTEEESQNLNKQEIIEKLESY